MARTGGLAEVLVEELGRQVHGLAQAGLYRQAELVDLQKLKPLGLPRTVVGPEGLIDGVEPGRLPRSRSAAAWEPGD